MGNNCCVPKRVANDTEAQQNPPTAVSAGPDPEKWKEDLYNIWERDITKLPCHTDLPRLFAKTMIVNEGQVVYDGFDGSRKDGVFQLLCSVCTISEDEVFHSYLEECYDDYVMEEGDMSEQLMSMFVNFMEMQEGAELTSAIGVLKFAHQKVIFPAFYCLRNKLEDLGRFKDKRGTWSIKIEREGNIISVKHKKTQQSDEWVGEDRLFEFDWELTGSFDLEALDMVDFAIHLSNLTLDPTNETYETRKANFDANLTIE